MSDPVTGFEQWLSVLSGGAVVYQRNTRRSSGWAAREAPAKNVRGRLRAIQGDLSR
jgi:hypothetical protein